MRKIDTRQRRPVTMDAAMAEQFRLFRFSNRYKNDTDALYDLLRWGLAALESNAATDTTTQIPNSDT